VYKRQHIGGPSEFAIVAPYNDTTVTITPSITTGSRTAGVPYTIVLDRFQTYTLQGDNPREDLTGTIIESSHPIAVFAGVRCCFIPANFYACDHIVEQMIPVAAWGKDFDTFPFMPRQNGLGDFLRILASVNGTLVKINGATVGTIDRGDFLETTVTEPLEISTSHPVLVAQYLTSEDYEGRIGDPFECLIPPTEQFLPRYTFITPTGYAENYVNIVTPTTSLDDLVLDGSPVNTSVFTDFGTRGLSAGTIPLTEGTHTITGITSFGIYVYGYNQYVSYGYPGGLALRKLREELVWYKNITINLTDFEIQNLFTNINIPEELENVTGKLNVIATLYSNTSQIINQSEIYSFYITDKNVSLTLETDKEKYKPNEPVTIYASAQNIGNITESYNLSLTKDGVEIYSDSFTLDPDEVYTYTVITASNTTFTLEALVEGVYVSDVINIETPNINVNLIVPEVVGLSPFDIGVLIENIGNIDVQINIQLNSNIWNISIPQGETRLIETTMSITENTTIYVIISGDVNQIIQKQIICGENAKINIIPQPTYLEDTLEIPYNIKNIGILDSEFNATFSINDQILTRNFFVPRGQNISDSVSFNLTRGTHLLRYISPFEDVNVTINVVSPPEFIVTSILPANMNFTLGQNVTLTFVVENIGGTEGEATLSLFMPDFEDTNRTWIRPGDEENISFSLTIPDDLEEKSYKGIYELDGERNEFMFFVQGIKISVDASLDKPLYEESETAIFTLNLGVPILSDPNEGNLVDIKQVFANTNETDVNFQVETYTSIIEEAYGIMWLDTDQNSSTGATDEWWPEYGLNDIGAEYAVAMEIGIQYNEAYLYQWTGYDFIEISHLPITLNEYYFTFLVPLSDIANDSDMDVTLMMEDYYGGIDIAPNEGHGTIGGFGLSLYARVKLSDYEEVKHFNLTDFETLQFDVPVHFNGQKLFYGIYMESGRALYLNAMYVHKKEIITLYTDKQVYNAGENVTIFVDTTKSGTLNITAPGFNTSIFVTGSTTLEFTLPKEVKSGTYYIDYTFDNFSSAYPFDVIGYSARILECSLDKEVYDPVDVVNIKMNVEVNQNISGSLKMWIYDPQDNPIDTFETDKNFMRGENKIEVMRDLSTNFSGIHVLVYGVYAHSDLILLASGAEYFDVEGVPDTIPPAISSENPRHNSFDVARPPAELNATVEDPDGDTMLVYIRWRNHDGDWVTLETYAGVYNGTYNFVPPSENDWIWGDTTYTWSVHVTDGVAWTNETYQYTTGGSRYDVSNNDLVNFQDAGLVWVHRTSEVPYDGLYDVNSDGQVNFQDAGLTWINRD